MDIAKACYGSKNRLEQRLFKERQQALEAVAQYAAHGVKFPDKSSMHDHGPDGFEVKSEHPVLWDYKDTVKRYAKEDDGGHLPLIYPLHWDEVHGYTISQRPRSRSGLYVRNLENPESLTAHEAAPSDKTSRRFKARRGTLSESAKIMGSTRP